MAENKTRIAVLVQNELNLDLKEVFHEAVEMGAEIVNTPLYHTQDTAEVIQAAKGFDYVVAGREPWNAEVLNACADHLKGIARFGAGFETVDLETAASLGIAVCNAPGVNAKAVAEQALALTLALLRKIALYDRDLRDGGVTAKMTQTLEGTVALLGFGNIGCEFAKLLSVFPVKVIAYDPFPNYQAANALGVEIVDLETAVKTADIISLHLPAVKNMKDFICKETIAEMKDGVYIINTSRGYVVNEHDLVAGLRSGKIAGAALDAFKVEPFDPDSELKTLPNVVLTPHSAAVSTQAVRMVFQHCAGVIADYMRGEDPRSLLNPNYALNRAE
ncbi:MAG: NAD(P)-dependent oxidoreductase [Eubacteriales bacterium]|nr:NAD(P)-dependent oxidoreductase [Eubacteriales bacterium]